MKKAYKVLSVLMVALTMVFACTTVFAANTQFISDMNSQVDLGDAGTTLKNIGNTILTIVTTVGMILAVVLVAILGIKYMMGSTEEKAEYKKSLMPYLVGAILVFGASAIGRAVVGFGASIVG